MRASYLTAEISASAVRANIAALRSRLAGDTRLFATVKTDCYGHGIRVLLPVIARDVDGLAVATSQEALTIRQLGCDLPILVFFSPGLLPAGAEGRDCLTELIAKDVTLTLASPDELPLVREAALQAASDANIHVNIDTGMTRCGVRPEDAPALTELIRGTSGLKLRGLYTHFASADEAAKDSAREQLNRFLDTVEACGGRGGLICHAANSAATIDLPETHLDMVRPGIAVYGYQPSDQMQIVAPLQPAMRVTAPLMQTKHVPAGTRCGYGLTHEFGRASRIGLVPIGYGDGYFRCLSGRAAMHVRGRQVPVCGRISMDQTILDLTDCPAAQVGDTVEIVSPDSEAANSVAGLARLAGTIPYEVTCRFGSRVRRVLVDRYEIDQRHASGPGHLTACTEEIC